MRLVDADPLKEKAFFHEIDNVSYVEEEDIDNAPTVDAVEVVRCKDCKFNPKYAYVGCPTAGLLLRDDNDFCSKGERRSEKWRR